MTTKLHQQATAALLAWCRAKKIKPIGKPRHVYPRAYVVGHAAPLCLIVAVPWPDAEPQLCDIKKANPLTTIHEFDKSLKAGDWCSVGYIVTAGWAQPVAIPAAAP